MLINILIIHNTQAISGNRIKLTKQIRIKIIPWIEELLESFLKHLLIPIEKHPRTPVSRIIFK